MKKTTTPISLFIGMDGKVKKVMTNEEPSLEVMQEFVGGLIEYAYTKGGTDFPVPYHALGIEDKENLCALLKVRDVIVNEEGLLMNLTPNPIATYAAYEGGWDYPNPLVGPAIIQVEPPIDMDEVEWVGMDWILDRVTNEDERDFVDSMMGLIALAREVGLTQEDLEKIVEDPRSAAYMLNSEDAL